MVIFACHLFFPHPLFIFVRVGHMHISVVELLHILTLVKVMMQEQHFFLIEVSNKNIQLWKKLIDHSEVIFFPVILLFIDMFSKGINI